jgi:ABC-type amino acid transport substrate-binding protein
VLAAALAAGSEPRKLRLGSDEWPPFTGSPGTTRSAIELVHSALERAGVEATTTIAEWKEIEAMIRRGELDGSAAMWRSERREEILLFSAPYLENRLVLIGRKGSDVSATRIGDLAGKRVAAVGRYAYGEEVEAAEGVLFVNARNDQDSLDKLLAGTVDYMLVDEIVARHLLTYQADDVAENLEIGLRPLAHRTLHLAIRRDLPEALEVIAAFDREIRAMQGDGTYAAILQVGWIRIDVDGDGLFELVPPGERIGQWPPGSVYDVFGSIPEGPPPGKQRIVIKGHIYEGWDAVPELYKQAPNPPSPGSGTSYKLGTTFMTLEF